MCLWTFYLNFIWIFLIRASYVENIRSDINETFVKFKVLENPSSFWEAKRTCLMDNKSYLAIVRDKDDSDQLVEILKKRNISSVWIGLTDFGRESKFYSTNDQSNWAFNMWDKGYPKDERNASDCVLMRRNDQDKYTWIDSHCAAKHAFACMSSNTSESETSSILPPHSHYINQCPEPFSPVDGDCFWLSSELLSWSDSRDACHSKSPESDLATIKNDFQQEYFAALISGSSAGFWMGLNYYNNAYQWILQQDMKFKRWGENQPHDSKKKNCTYIGNNEDNLGNWYTASCSNKFQYICQTLLKKNQSETSNNKRPLDDQYDEFLFKKGECQKEGYYYYHNSCYRLHHDKLLSHNDAIKFCNNETFRNSSGYNFLVDMVPLPSAGEKNFILADLRRIGSYLPNNFVWLNIRGNGTEERVSQRDVSDKINFPNFYSARIKHLCFKLLTNGVVNSSDCDDNSKGIPMCKYQLSNFNQKSLRSNRYTVTCPERWTLFNSFCYYLINETFDSHYQAKMACLKRIGTIISIDMNLEAFLADYLKKSPYSSRDLDVWIGLEAKNTNNSGRLSFNWMNEAPVTYLNLESIDVVGNQSMWCANFIIRRGLWRLVNCTQTKARVVCQQPANIRLISLSNKGNGSKPIFKYSKPGYIYKSEPADWKTANAKCRSLKTEKGFISTLVTINSLDEVSNILSKNRTYRSKYAWIGLTGLYDHFDNYYLRWSDGSRVLFQNYQWDNLMKLTGSENCVMIDIRNGNWLGSKCSVKRPYFCRILKRGESDNNKVDKKLHELFSANEIHGNSFCPEHFQEYFTKCYRVIEDDPMDWISADSYCQDLVPKSHSKGASLASIETKFENSFVYSLLSSNIYSTNETGYWIGERYASRDTRMPKCAGMSSHPDPYIGARWFAENCAKKMKFICSSFKIPGDKPPSIPSMCPIDYTEYSHSNGTSCYHFENVHNNWKEARHLCTFQRHKSLLSLPSHYHLHFLISQSDKMGLSRDNPLFLGAEIEQSQKYFHWQWDNGQDVRYTIWNRIPKLAQLTNGPLCLYLLTEKDNRGRFGIQVDECDNITDKGVIVCESTKDDIESLRPNPNKNCLTDSKGGSYEGDTNTTVNGLRCMRWDLVNGSEKVIGLIRRDPNKHNYIQYHSNECRYIPGMSQSTTSCVISLDSDNGSVQLQECTVAPCGHKILHHTEELTPRGHHSNLVTVIIVTLLLLICVIACIALLSWRRWNKTSLFGGYLRRGQFSMLNGNQSRGTSFNNPIYSPVNC